MRTTPPRLNVRKKQIDAVVEQYHRLLKEAGEYQLPISVERLAKNLGVQVTRVATDDADLSGFVYRDPSTRAAVIGVNREHRSTRQRFTIAHELGHLALHSFDELHYDRKGYGTGYGQIRRRDAQSATGENRDEVEANQFAALLLMPEDLVLDRLEHQDALDIFETSVDTKIKAMAREFGVSPQALTIRLIQLGVLTTS